MGAAGSLRTAIMSTASLDTEILVRLVELDAKPEGGITIMAVDPFACPFEARHSSEEILLTVSHYQNVNSKPDLIAAIAMSTSSAILLRYYLDLAIEKREVACADRS
jgi:hypothetical protein